jgi:hypothetical protein
VPGGQPAKRIVQGLFLAYTESSFSRSGARGAEVASSGPKSTGKQAQARRAGMAYGCGIRVAVISRCCKCLQSVAPPPPGSVGIGGAGQSTSRAEGQRKRACRTCRNRAGDGKNIRKRRPRGRETRCSGGKNVGSVRIVEAHDVPAGEQRREYTRCNHTPAPRSRRC